MGKRNDYEDQLSYATAQYLDLRELPYTHFPAGEHRATRVGAKLKRMGLKRGLPDYLIFKPYPGVIPVAGLAIELKSPKGRLSKDQIEWRGILFSCGWGYEVCRTIDEVTRVVEECYG